MKFAALIRYSQRRLKPHRAITEKNTSRKRIVFINAKISQITQFDLLRPKMQKIRAKMYTDTLI